MTGGQGTLSPVDGLSKVNLCLNPTPVNDYEAIEASLGSLPKLCLRLLLV